MTGQEIYRQIQETAHWEETIDMIQRKAKAEGKTGKRLEVYFWYHELEQLKRVLCTAEALISKADFEIVSNHRPAEPRATQAPEAEPWPNTPGEWKEMLDMCEQQKEEKSEE